MVLPIFPSSWPHCLPVLPSSIPTSLLPLFQWSLFLALPSSIPTFSCVPIFMVLSVSLFSQPHLLAVPSSSISTFYCVSIFFVVLPSSPFSQPHLLLVPSSVATSNNPPVPPPPAPLATGFLLPLPSPDPLPGTSQCHSSPCHLQGILWIIASRRPHRVVLPQIYRDHLCSRTGLWSSPLQYYHNL